mgnify:CR=1 FL=1|jgi:hypothetical protein
MPRTNLSLGNLYRATQGSTRTTQQVSMNAMNAAAGTAAAFSSFAVDSVTANLPTYTYIVESTSETATFSFGSQGSLHGARVGSVAANYTVSFDNANFSVGAATLGASPSFPITPASIAASNYSEAQSTLSMKYADGYNLAATNYNVASTKTLYAVDVYNTINQPDFCLLFGTKVKLSNNTEINVEDLNVGDVIKAWVPAGLPDENLDVDSDQIEWRFHQLDSLEGTSQDVVVSDLTFNFASGYFSINNGAIKATGTHPLFVWDNEVEKYKFKNVEDILPGDKLVKADETEELVYDIAIIEADIEIVTVNVESADVYISNGYISHNKGTTSQPSIPAAGLRMYLDPSKTASFGAGSLPSTGTPTVDFLDLTGYGTGVRPSAQSPMVRTNGNPSYNNGASRKERYYSFDGGDLFFKDTTSNISGGSTQFDTSAYSIGAWIRLTSTPSVGWYLIFGKQSSAPTRVMAFYLYSYGNGTYLLHDGTTGGGNSNTFSLTNNVWYFVGYTAAQNGTNVFYLDNSAIGTVSNGSTTYTTSAQIMIGGNQVESSNFYTGHLGPMVFYNLQLSGTKMGEIYSYFSPTYK